MNSGRGRPSLLPAIMDRTRQGPRDFLLGIVPPGNGLRRVGAGQAGRVHSVFELACTSKTKTTGRDARGVSFERLAYRPLASDPQGFPLPRCPLPERAIGLQL